ncbi:MAG: hypothetical protein LUH13_02920 [Oscillospiraceae bacterium]|nr:hypothetical protein [Oscillospiraceae bacterium]
MSCWMTPSPLAQKCADSLQRIVANAAPSELRVLLNHAVCKKEIKTALHSPECSAVDLHLYKKGKKIALNRFAYLHG